MSYTLSAFATKAEIADTATVVIAGYEPAGPATDEATEHLDAVSGIVAQLTQVIGTDDDTLHVSISGHANTGHRPADGWGDEFVTVTVRVKR